MLELLIRLVKSACRLITMLIRIRDIRLLSKPLNNLFFLCSIGILLGACEQAERAQTSPQSSNPAPSSKVIEMIVTGQALIKLDPRVIWQEPFVDIRPVLETADIGFTNFEMAVNPDGNGCELPDDYVTITGNPDIEPSVRPGNTSGPHAVSADIMEYLASMNLKLMSLANNHSWDLGECGVIATIDAAEKYGVVHAGTGLSNSEATAPAYIDVKGLRIGLVAAATSRDERHLVSENVNGVWTGHEEDWQRNIAAIKEAATKADFVIFYQHFQIHDEDFEDTVDGERTSDGHYHVDSVAAWQDGFARAVIDAGASVYIGHGHRGFDGVEIYKGRPIFRQFGGLAYHAMRDIGGYPGEYAFWGLLGALTIENGDVVRMEFIPLSLNEGQDLVDEYDRRGFLTRRGAPQIATGEMAKKILRRFQRLSAEYGSHVSIDGERAILDFLASAAP